MEVVYKSHGKPDDDGTTCMPGIMATPGIVS